MSQQHKLYVFVLLACSAGYIWLYYHISKHFSNNTIGEVCLIKSFTGFPCPSCGSTRSVVALLGGNFYEALLVNPIGYVLLSGLVIAPVWILKDLLTADSSFYNFFRSTELFLQKPQHYVPLALLVFANWVWNIAKGL